ncbi:NAC-alpha domain-containing protein 1-like [Esox lucius]|uniref:NAC-alpha domain-containing protein 1-like n=1 Tax=Esox lucius TaxID=8010 RepID=UPI001476E1DD|nr:NAC-alpha domain-containing protein 1-like [Esox lucius]
MEPESDWGWPTRSKSPADTERGAGGSPHRNGAFDDGTAGPSTLEASPPQPIQEPEPILAPEPEQVQAGEAESRPPASRAPRPRVPDG